MPDARPAPTTGVLDEIEAAAWRDVVAATPQRVGAAIGLAVRRVGSATMFLAPGLPVALLNRVVGLGAGQPATDAVVDEVLARFGAAGIHAPYVHVGASASPALTAWLVARGFAPALERARVEVVRGRDPVPVVDGPLAVREVGRDDAARLAAVLVSVHGFPSILVPQLEALVGRPRWRACAGFVGDELVGGALVFVDDRRAWIGLPGVLRSHRRRGVLAGLIAGCVAGALDRGATVIATDVAARDADPGGLALDDLVRCGFHVAGTRVDYTVPAEAG